MQAKKCGGIKNIPVTKLKIGDRIVQSFFAGEVTVIEKVSNIYEDPDDLEYFCIVLENGIEFTMSKDGEVDMVDSAEFKSEMTSDELRAAAEYCVREYHAASAIGKVARAYLAERDPTPVTEEWLRALGFGVVDLTWHGNGPEVAFEFGGRLGLRCQEEDTRASFRPGDRDPKYQANVWRAYLLSSDGFDGTEDHLTAVPTRGHVRRLCSVLGVTLKGSI